MTQFRWAFIISLTWASLFASISRADESAILNEPPVVADKYYQTKNRFEISVFPYDLSFRNRYVTHPYAAHASIGYHFFDWLALEAFGGYVFKNGDTPITDNLRVNTSAQDFELAGLWRTKWFVGSNVLWAPFYGKFSLFSEVEGSFQLYALLGLGADGIERPITGSTPTSTRLSVNAGGGLRLFFAPSFAIRAEVREEIGKNALLSSGDGAIQPTTWCQLGVSLFL